MARPLFSSEEEFVNRQIPFNQFNNQSLIVLTNTFFVRFKFNPRLHIFVLAYKILPSMSDVSQIFEVDDIFT